MARIRTLKPEFPQSESMGRVSRDARLLFVLLWTICDDYGRARASSRMLASLLYPYDDGEGGAARTAGADVARWLLELEQESCIRLYEHEGSQYLEVCNWLKHQKIDKPSKPQFPEPPASPREVSRDTREPSENPRLGREGKGKEGSRGERARERGAGGGGRGTPPKRQTKHTRKRGGGGKPRLADRTERSRESTGSISRTIRPSASRMARLRNSGMRCRVLREYAMEIP